MYISDVQQKVQVTLLAFSGSQKLKKQKKNLIYFAKNFRHFLHSKVIEGDLFLAEHLVRIIC